MQRALSYAPCGSSLGATNPYSYSAKRYTYTFPDVTAVSRSIAYVYAYVYVDEYVHEVWLRVSAYAERGSPGTIVEAVG